MIRLIKATNLRSLNSSLERLIEEILDTGRQVSNQSERISNDVETEDEHVDLLNELFRVVTAKFQIQYEYYLKETW